MSPLRSVWNMMIWATLSIQIVHGYLISMTAVSSPHNLLACRWWSCQICTTPRVSCTPVNHSRITPPCGSGDTRTPSATSSSRPRRTRPPRPWSSSPSTSGTRTSMFRWILLETYAVRRKDGKFSCLHQTMLAKMWAPCQLLILFYVLHFPYQSRILSFNTPWKF